jgi:hypothetical protein
MTQRELSRSEIHSLSWRLIAQLILEVEDEVAIADLHPGDGQYDCLSLINTRAEQVVLLNRNGSSAANAAGIVHDIWDLAAQDLESAMTTVIKNLKIPVSLFDGAERKPTVVACRKVARWLAQSDDGERSALCCWFDSSYGAGPAEQLLSAFAIPESWKVLPAPYVGSEWSAWLYALTIDEAPVALVNTHTGEAIAPSGAIWELWEQMLAPRAKSAKTSAATTPKVVSLPAQSVDDESRKLFSRVFSFDGYQVFGKENLQEIARTTAEQWESTHSLPADVAILKGVLFLAWRTQRFVDGYPSAEDMPFLQALATAIDSAS